MEALKAVILFTGQELCGRKIMIKIDGVRNERPSREDRGDSRGDRSRSDNYQNSNERDSREPRRDTYDRRWDNTSTPQSAPPSDEWNYNPRARANQRRIVSKIDFKTGVHLN